MSISKYIDTNLVELDDIILKREVLSQLNYFFIMMSIYKAPTSIYYEIDDC
jgi:hypothetical protein